MSARRRGRPPTHRERARRSRAHGRSSRRTPCSPIVRQREPVAMPRAADSMRPSSNSSEATFTYDRGVSPLPVSRASARALEAASIPSSIRRACASAIPSELSACASPARSSMRTRDRHRIFSESKRLVGAPHDRHRDETTETGPRTCRASARHPRRARGPGREAPASAACTVPEVAVERDHRDGGVLRLPRCDRGPRSPPPGRPWGRRRPPRPTSGPARTETAARDRARPSGDASRARR